jgi:citrate lyase beta subunit
MFRATGSLGRARVLTAAARVRCRALAPACGRAALHGAPFTAPPPLAAAALPAPPTPLVQAWSEFVARDGGVRACGLADARRSVLTPPPPPAAPPLRSVLYVPASNARALARASAAGADALIVDLEDAVAPEAKEGARLAAAAAFLGLPTAGADGGAAAGGPAPAPAPDLRRSYATLRVNAAPRALAAADLAIVARVFLEAAAAGGGAASDAPGAAPSGAPGAAPALRALVIPKVEGAATLAAVRVALLRAAVLVAALRAAAAAGSVESADSAALPPPDAPPAAVFAALPALRDALRGLAALPLWACIETPRGVLRAAEIAGAPPEPTGVAAAAGGASGESGELAVAAALAVADDAAGGGEGSAGAVRVHPAAAAVLRAGAAAAWGAAPGGLG